MIPDLLAQLNNAWLQFPAALINESDLARAGWHHCAGWNSQAFAHVHPEFHVCVHSRPQFEIGIWNIDAQLCRALCLFHERIDDGDLSFEAIVWIRVGRDRYG